MNPKDGLQKPVDLICVGETLIDFIGAQVEAPISETKDYHRYLGGSPTNVAMNMSRLGMKVAMISSVGNDGFGDYMLTRFEEVGMDTRYVKKIDHAHLSPFIRFSSVSIT